MRCPECEIRNSVATRECIQCGHRFKKKPLPLALVGGAVGVVVAASLGLWAVSNAFTQKDPQVSLENIAKRLAAGPKSPEDANAMKADLDKVVRNYLKRYGSKPPAELTARMQNAFPNLFEIHVFELPRGLKIVEVDTVLQATEYLVIQTPSETKAVTLPGLEVFDAAKVINDSTGPVLVVLGHTGGQSPKRPQVKVFALLPDDVRDQSDRCVPPLYGEGTAAFLKNERDIAMDVSLYTIAAHQNLFNPGSTTAIPIQDEIVRNTLLWNQGKYTMQQATPRSHVGALYAVAHALRGPAEQQSVKDYFSSFSQQQLEAARASIGTYHVGFTVAKLKATSGSRRQRQKPVYGIYTGDKGVSVTLVPQSGAGKPAWIVESISITPVKDIVANVVPASTGKGNSHLVPALVRQQVGTVAEPRTAAPIVERVSPTQQQAVEPAPVVNQPVNSAPPAVKQPTNSAPPVVTQPVKNTPPAVTQPANPAPPVVTQPVKNTPPVTTQTQKSTSPTSNQSRTATAAPQQPPAVKIPGEGEQRSTGYITTSSDPNVKVRRGPSLVYRTVLQLNRGDRVEILGRKDDWYKIRANGKDGFVHKDLIANQKPSALPEPTPEPPAARPAQRVAEHVSERKTERPRSQPRRSSSNTTHSIAKQSPPIAEPDFVP